LQSSWPEWADVTIDPTTFPLHHIKNVPQQPNSYDCGVFTELYVDALLASLPKTAADITLPSNLDATAARHEMARIIQLLPSLSSSSSSSSSTSSSLPIPSSSPPKYEVERIVSDRVNEVSLIVEYLIKWVGYEESANT
jgi:hypothetical protein